MAELRITGNRWLMHDDTGYAVEDTDAKSVLTVPDGAIDLTGINAVTVSFPNFVFNPPEYDYARGTAYPNKRTETCATYVMLGGQSWGPPGDGESYNYALADTVLGALPGGADFIDVQATLVRTAVPADIFTVPSTAVPIEGELMSPDSGSIPLEVTPDYRRQINIMKIGSNVVLRRYQSVKPGTRPVRQIDYKYNGSVYQATPDAPPQYAMGPGDFDACSTSGSLNLASTWKLEAVITPGRHTA